MVESAAASKSLGRICIFGDTGMGKSTLLSCMLGKPIATAGIEKPAGVTTEIAKIEGKWLGQGELLTAFDAPGFGDKSVKWEELIALWNSTLQKEVLTALVYVFRIDSHRITSYQQMAIDILTLLTGANGSSWSSMVFVGTHADKLDEKTPKEVFDSVLQELNRTFTGIDKAKTIAFSKKSSDIPLAELHDFFVSQRGNSITLKKVDPGVVRDKAVNHLGRGCFATNTLVNLLKPGGTIERVTMDSLRLGDLVEVEPNRFDPVRIISKEEELSEVLEIRMTVNAKEDSITVTPNHLIYAWRQGSAKLIPAEELMLTDELMVRTGESLAPSKILLIGRRRGIEVMNIRTRSLKLLANNIACSCRVKGDAGDTVSSWIVKLGDINQALPQWINQQVRRLYDA